MVQQALVDMMNSDHDIDKANHNATHAVQFFGVPNVGMNTDPILRMARGQPNEPFIMSLSRDSDLLHRLGRAFSKVIKSRELDIFSFYELQESVIPIQVCLSSQQLIYFTHTSLGSSHGRLVERKKWSARATDLGRSNLCHL